MKICYNRIQMTDYQYCMIISHHKFHQNTAEDGDALFSASFHYLLYLAHNNLNDISEFIYWLNLYLIEEIPLLAV